MMMGSWKETAINLLWLKDVVAILPTVFEESLIYQLYRMVKEIQLVRMLLFSLFTT